MIVEIEKIIKENKNYLYQRIKNFLDKVSKTGIFATQEQIKIEGNDGISLKEKLTNILEAFIKENNINIKDIIKAEPINIYFDTIIQFLKNNPREFHVLILMNLLTSKKGKEAINKYSENKGKKTTTNDFIIQYTILAFEKVFNKNFNEIDSDKLKEAYLYFLFQIKDSENVKKLKILIYEYLYEKPDISEFIKKSSIEIVSKGAGDDSKLRKYESKYSEFNISINNVQNNINLFFGEDLKKNISNLLDFFNPNNILNNNIYKNDVKLQGQDNIIVIDDLNFKKDKIHLFSTEFLVVNGLKPKIYENDFQIFNEDNYSIDLFAKFLRKIIFEINESILKNNFENDFLKKHLIKINTKEFYHFISAKLFNADKHELNKEKNENNIKNPLIKIRMYQEKNEKKNYNENNNKNSNEKSVSISAAY